MSVVSVLPVAVLLIAASLGWCHRRLLRGINIWYAAWFAIAFMPSAANTPYFQYFFKNINSSIFGWFGYVATTSGMLLQESSYWLYIALYFVFTGAFIYALIRLLPAHSSLPVRAAMPRLSPDISQHAYKTAYAPFKPNKSG